MPLSATPTPIAGVPAGSAPPTPYIPRAAGTTEWCWAACAEMAATRFGLSASQCRMANTLFGLKNCCKAGPPAACDKPCPTGQMRGVHTGNGLKCKAGTAGSVAEATLVRELKAGRLVQISFLLATTAPPSKHAVLAWDHSATGGVNQFDVHDPNPKYATSVYDYPMLLSAGGSGSWDHTWTGLEV